MKKLEALNPFSGEEGFVHRGDCFETSEARANLLLRAKLVKELPDDAPVEKTEVPQAAVIGKPVPATKSDAPKPKLTKEAPHA